MTTISALPPGYEIDPANPGKARRVCSPAQASASNEAALMEAAMKTKHGKETHEFLTQLATATNTRRTDRTMPPSEGGYAVVHLVLPYPPSTNTAYNPINGVMVKSKEAREYTKAVKDIVAGLPKLAGDVMVTIYVFRPRRARDLPNCEKVMIDAMKGLLWRDDEQINAMPMYRFEDKQNPRVELTAVGRLADLKGEK